MKKSNKIIALCLAFVLLFAAVGGTLAWLTDKDKAENVFSVGSVDIKLTETNKINEEEIEIGNDGKYHFDGVMPGDKITKTPVITNVGKNDAYVRVVVEVKNDVEQFFGHDGYSKANLINTMDKAIDSVFEAKIGKDTEGYNNFYNNIFDGWGISYLKNAGTTGAHIRFAMNQRNDDAVKCIDSVRAMADGDSWQFAKTNTFKSDAEKQSIENDIGYYAYGNGYYGDLYTNIDGKLIYVFYLELKPEKSYTLFNGFNVPEEFDTQSLAFFNGLEVNIYADAIQTQGFEATETEEAWVVAINALNEQHSLADLVAGN